MKSYWSGKNKECLYHSHHTICQKNKYINGVITIVRESFSLR